MGNLTTVVLENTANNTTHEFEVNHAERLLRTPNNGGWILPDDSPFYFDFKNGIGFKQSKGATNRKEKSGDDK